MDEFKQSCVKCGDTPNTLCRNKNEDLFCLKCRLIDLESLCVNMKHENKLSALDLIKDHVPDIVFKKVSKDPPEGLVAVYLKPETVDFIKSMALRMATQNNRMTATPYFFTIRETSVVTAADGRGDSYEFLNRDCDATYTIEEMREYINDRVEETDEDVADDDSDTLTKETLLDLLDRGCLDELADALDMELLELQTIEVNTNGFFTEKAAEEHLEQRGHRYREGSSVWLEAAPDNPEMDAVWDLIMQIGELKNWRK